MAVSLLVDFRKTGDWHLEVPYSEPAGFPTCKAVTTKSCCVQYGKSEDAFRPRVTLERTPRII